MPRLDIHLFGQPSLRTRSDEVPAVDEDIRSFLDDLFETMDAAEGIGLAANQVGVTKRVAVVGLDDVRLAMVNPVIVETSGRDRAEEGCLSIPDVFADVTRSERIVLQALDRSGEGYELEAEGLLARAIQHEIDHLDGILFIDHLSVLKRQLLVARWRREHKGQELIKRLRSVGSRPD